jgi:hypothetical protein
MSASDSAASAASATDESRYRGHPLAGALAFRRSVAALFSFGLRFPVICNGEKALLQTPLLASSSRTGRSAGEAGSEAARERFAKPRAGTAARSTFRIASGMCPSMSELRPM